jgi:hypothetical protein
VKVDLLTGRLRSQGIEWAGSRRPKSPHDVVARLGAVQAQDYLGSLWAIGLRTDGCTQSDIEQAIAERSIVRTWPMRGTLHFVAAEDIRWMLDLMATRVIERSASRNRQLGLDAETFARAGDIFSAALEGERRLTRAELMQLLERGGISTEGQRGYHLLWHHAQQALICLGPTRGKQQTFVLLDEWVPPAPRVSREEALARIAGRYFAGHGPATFEDLARWTGLTRTDTRAGLSEVAGGLTRSEISGVEYWSAGTSPRAGAGQLHLLPGFDEFIIGYAARRPMLGKHFTDFNASVSSNGMFAPTVVVGGRVVGTWRRTVGKEVVRIEVTPFEPLTAHTAALAGAAERYGRFLGLRAELSP